MRKAEIDLELTEFEVHFLRNQRRLSRDNSLTAVGMRRDQRDFFRADLDPGIKGRRVRTEVRRKRIDEIRCFFLRRGIGSERNRSEEHTSELQSLMRISSAVFCLHTKIKKQ